MTSGEVLESPDGDPRKRGVIVEEVSIRSVRVGDPAGDGPSLVAPTGSELERFSRSYDSDAERRDAVEALMDHRRTQ